MLKVFLVEDEIVMREGIKNNINWEEEGFLFAGEASDGELAYPLIQKTKPDIVITDIKMPFMNGLELSALIKKELPDTHIIILSGYDVFDYAKEGISIGVSEYLVKPVTSAKLLEAVKGIAAVIEKEKEKVKYLEQFKQEMKELEAVTRGNFLHEILARHTPSSELFEKGKSLGIDLAAGAYNIMLFKLRELGEKEMGYSQEMADAEEELMLMAEKEKRIYVFRRGVEGVEILILGENNEDVIRARNAFIKKMLGVISNYENVRYFGGIGKVVNRLGEITDSYDGASKAFSYRYMISHNRIISIEDTEKIYLSGEEIQINLNTLDLDKIDRGILLSFLRSGLKEEIQHFIEDFFDSLGDNIKSLLFRQYIVTDMYFCIISFVEELGCDFQDIAEKFGDLKTAFKVMNSTSGCKNYLIGLIKEAILIRDQASTKKYSSIVDKAKRYIGENYHAEHISLNNVAAHVNISPSHFSSIYSQEEGQTFIEYLTAIRMNKAKELLMCSNMKSSEIGFAVGYRDSHYFSYLFKKTQNCTPKEYRMRRSEV